MADAGKIMIMPKGAYDASASYEVLDLVTHKGNVWVAKRNVTGVEPNSANSADWFLMADLANYLPLSGGRVNGNLDIWSDMYLSRLITFENAHKMSQFGVFDNGTLGMIDNTTGEWIFAKDLGTTPVFYGTATGNLPLSGGEITPVNSDTGLLINGTESGKTRSLIRYDSHGARLGYLGFDENGAMLVDYNLTPRRILHTGNKPSGLYTGTGTARTIDTGAGTLGQVCFINDLNSGSSFALVSTYGSIGQRYAEFAKETPSDIVFENGVIHLSASSYLNVSGFTFSYCVL